jgi:anti-sigma B factor antagonist
MEVPAAPALQGPLVSDQAERTDLTHALRLEEVQATGLEVVLAAHGELDLHAAPELRDRLDVALDEGAKVIVLDLSAVTFIDSMALGVLLGAVNRLRRRGGDLRLVVPNPQLRRIFEISLLDRIFTLDWLREEPSEPVRQAG